MRELYPQVQPYAVCRLDVGGGHEIYVEECGTRRGLPVLFLHGGPGSGCSESHRRYFDPARYRVILFDQRGCNRSHPRGAIVANDTAALLADMERIRTSLGIDRWLLYGGSWGATLALLYAEAYPQHVAGLIVRGTFLARQRDLDWFARDGASRIFPEAWDEFVHGVPEEERDDLVGAYHRRLHGSDAVARLAAARGWSRWGGRVATYLLPPAPPEEEDPDRIVCEAAIETHYAVNRYFIRENQILEDVARLPRVPTVIIHGRRDLTCTLDAAWLLHRALPHSELTIVNEGGHLASEPPMTDALVRAADAMAERLS